MDDEVFANAILTFWKYKSVCQTLFLKDERSIVFLTERLGNLEQRTSAQDDGKSDLWFAIARVELQYRRMP